MIKTTTTTVTITILLTLACCATSVPSPAPETSAAPAPEMNSCLPALANMSDCLTFVEDGSNLTKPDKGCCPELAGLIDSNPICLCELLGKPDTIGIKIDLNKAIKLPSICGVSTPPVSTCAAVGVPVSLPPSISDGSLSPSIAPGASGSSNDAASSPGGLAPSSSDASNSPTESKNGVSAIKTSTFTNFIFGLFTLSLSSFF